KRRVAGVEGEVPRAATGMGVAEAPYRTEEGARWTGRGITSRATDLPRRAAGPLCSARAGPSRPAGAVRHAGTALLHVAVVALDGACALFADIDTVHGGRRAGVAAVARTADERALRHARGRDRRTALLHRA